MTYPAPAPLRILYVEDNDIVRLQTAELLGSPDREIVSCDSAEQALKELERAAFDVTITDISLPVMSGIELTKRILKNTPDAWIIIMSGYALPEPDKLGRNTRVLPKPVETEQIDALLSDIRRFI